MFRVPIPPARPGGVALACGRHLPRPAGRPPHGPAGPALPPVVHHRRPPPLRGVSRSFPPPGHRRLSHAFHRQDAKTHGRSTVRPSYSLPHEPITSCGCRKGAEGPRGRGAGEKKTRQPREVAGVERKTEGARWSWACPSPPGTHAAQNPVAPSGEGQRRARPLSPFAHQYRPCPRLLQGKYFHPARRCRKKILEVHPGGVRCH